MQFYVLPRTDELHIMTSGTGRVRADWSISVNFDASMIHCVRVGKAETARTILFQDWDDLVLVTLRLQV